MNGNQVQASNFYADDLKVLHKNNQKLLSLLVDLLVDADYKGVNDMWTAVKSTKYSIQGYLEMAECPDEVKDKVYDAGYTSALIDLARLYGKRSVTYVDIANIKTGYKERILTVLFERGTLLHKELAAALNVSASGLNAIIKLMNGTSVKMINIEEVSKYKLYSLTPIAYKYIKENRPAAKKPVADKITESEYSRYFMLGVSAGVAGVRYSGQNWLAFAKKGVKTETKMYADSFCGSGGEIYQNNSNKQAYM